MLNIKEEDIVDIITKRKSGTPVYKIKKEYHISNKPYKNIIEKALQLNLLTQEEFKKIYIKKPKLNLKIIKNIVEDRKEGLFRENILEKYDISKATFISAMGKGIVLGYLTRKEYEYLTKEFCSLGFEGKVRKNGEKVARQSCSDAWSKGMGKAHEKYCNSVDNENSPLVKAAIAGGNKTQEIAPHVLENLKGAEIYGQYQKYTYKGIEFDSKSELWLALMLRECGLIKKIKEGKNFQVPCGPKFIDFVVDGIAIEYHPTPKGIDSHNNYKERREEELRECGFSGKLIVIEKENDIFKSGLVNSFLEYTKKRRTVNKKLEKVLSLEEQIKEENKRIEKRERASEYKVDKECDKEEVITKNKDYDDKVPF
ncbi:MAG: hypothetical protein NT139_02090 [Candidatus Woesearchaeota archaeon]|nr:hypothetical protein [Candidatus Woesearchaeota archaeon]